MQARPPLQRIEANDAPVVVDPRSERDFRKGHIPGAINASVRKILLNRAQLPQDKNCEMLIACMQGQRAVMASFLRGLYGYRNMDLLEGYLEGWIEAGPPIE